MALGKKIAKLTAATLFTLFLSLFVFLLPFYDLTSYNTPLKSLSKNMFLEQASQINILIEQSCRNSQRIEIPIQNEKISFECGEIKDADSLFSKAFDTGYYKNYSCSLLDCVKQPNALVSSFGHKLVWNAILISLLMFLISGTVLLLLLEKKIKGIGYSLIIVGINSPLLFFAKNIIPTTGMAAIDTFINNIFGQTIWNFLLILVAGIVLVAIGLYTKK